MSRLKSWGLICLVTLVSMQAQGQDAGKALGGLFQNLLRPAQNSNGGNAGGSLGGLLGVGGSQGQGINVSEVAGLLNQSMEQIDEPKEIEIGRQLASVLLGAKPLHPDMALQRYVNRLGRWISLQSTRPDLPWSFAVLDDPGFNAFATPGGFVFVTKGLIDQVTDESELAGILAHEIAHVVSKHHLRAIQKTAKAGLLSKVVASQLKNDLAGGISSQLLSLGKDLYSKGLDQDDELEADRNGVALSTRAGFDPYGLVAVLQMLRTTTPDNPLFALTFSTHPAPQTRLDQIELAMGQRLDTFAGKPVVTIAHRLTRAGNR